MFTVYDIARLTEFDCYCCTPIINCKVVGCACDYECGEYCPQSISRNCNHIGKRCRPVTFANMACLMILDGQYS